MEQYTRHPRDVVGRDPVLLDYWNTMPARARLRLLDSGITVSTLGELKLLEEQLAREPGESCPTVCSRPRGRWEPQEKIEIGKQKIEKGARPMLLFVEYPKCTTCQRAKKFLDDRGAVYTDRHIKEENPTADELRTWWQASGLPLKRFFNTSGLQYKALGLKDKLPSMSEEEQLALLATDGMLVKRPILVGEQFVKVGFREKEWEEIG